VPKWLLVVGGLFAFLGLLFCAMLLSGLVISSKPVCTGFPVMSLPPQGGMYRAEVENNTCDANGSLETVVSLSNGTPNTAATQKTSVFIASSTVVSGPGVYAPLALTLRWLSNSELEITYPVGTKLQSSAGTTYGVSVSYRERSVP
jgi:hypothetical protein